LGNQQIHKKTALTDLFTINRDGMNNTQSKHACSLDNPHASTEAHFQRTSSVKIWCSAIRSQVIGPFVLEEHLTSERFLLFVVDELPVLLDDVPLHIRRKLWLADGAPPHFGRQVNAFLNQHFQYRWRGCQGLVACPPRSPDIALLHYHLCGRMKALVLCSEVQQSGWDVRWHNGSSGHKREDKPFLTGPVASLSPRATMCIDNEWGHFEQLYR